MRCLLSSNSRNKRRRRRKRKRRRGRRKRRRSRRKKTKEKGMQESAKRLLFRLREWFMQIKLVVVPV